MIKNHKIYFLGLVILFSCKNDSEKEKGNINQNTNELIVTSKGDTLEDGFWIFEKGDNGISSKGMFEDGYKINEWIYKTNIDSVKVTWDVTSVAS